jgi:hypothetical protein
MDAFKLAVKRPGFTLALALFAAAASAVACRAEHFDGSTLCRWSRTWHGPNSIWRPLSPYYVPRPADPCLHGVYGHGWHAGNRYADGCYADGCGYAVEGGYFNENVAEYDGENLTGYGDLPAIPVGLERLGQIPNDLGISGGAPTGAPARPGR